MKKTTAVFAAFLAVSGVLTGVCGIQKETFASRGNEENIREPEEAVNPDVPQIDTTMDIQPGTWVAVVSKNTSGRFWKLVREGMEDAVRDVNEAYGYKKDEQISMTFEGPDNELDVETQINTMDAVISENPDALCISAGDMDSCQAQLETARENGIPVVAFDSNVSETDLTYSYHGTDNAKIGRLGAQKLVEAIEGKGKVAVFSVQEKTRSIQERIQAFTDVISEYPDIEIAEMVYQDEVTDMKAAMQGVLTLHPDLAGIFCTNADIADLYLKMEKPEGSPQPVFIGVDATESQQKAVREGRELGIVSQNPYAMGYRTVLSALTATSQETETGNNEILEPVWIDVTNLDDPAYSSYIY